MIKGEVDKNYLGFLNVYWRFRNGSIVGYLMIFVGYDLSVLVIYVYIIWKDLFVGWIKVGNWVDVMIIIVKFIKMCWNGICFYVVVIFGG